MGALALPGALSLLLHKESVPGPPKGNPLFAATWVAIRRHGDGMAGEAAVLDWPHIALLVLGWCG